MPKTCSTCQFNDNGYCQEFDHTINGRVVICSEYIKKENIIGHIGGEAGVSKKRQPSWEEYLKTYIEVYPTFFNGEYFTIPLGWSEAMANDIILFIRQAIKEERNQAVREVLGIIEKGWNGDELIEEVKKLLK